MSQRAASLSHTQYYQPRGPLIQSRKSTKQTKEIPTSTERVELTPPVISDTHQQQCPIGDQKTYIHTHTPVALPNHLHVSRTSKNFNTFQLTHSRTQSPQRRLHKYNAQHRRQRRIHRSTHLCHTIANDRFFLLPFASTLPLKLRRVHSISTLALSAQKEKKTMFPIPLYLPLLTCLSCVDVFS